jgi:UDP-N-acetylglucosamine 3-dehydrogenase
MLKVGVVGLGQMGQNHVRLYSEMGCLRTVADVAQGRASEIGDKYHVPRRTVDHRQMFNGNLGTVDAVSIAVPTSQHYAIARAFIDAGVHCLIEKPITNSIDQAKELIDLAKDRHLVLAVGHIEMFNPAVTALKRVLDSGALGRLLTLSARRVGPYAPRVRDVGIVVDIASHDIGVLNYLVGKQPISVFSRVGQLKHCKEDRALIVLDYGEITGSIEVNWNTPRKTRTLVATGSEGIAYLDYIDQTLTVNDIAVSVEKCEPLKLELLDFLASVEEKRAPFVTGADGLAILRVALEASGNRFTTL